MILYVQFIAEVSVGGDHNAISYWSRDKHGKTIAVQERGSYLVLTMLTRDDKGELVPSGSQRRVPITNVAYISELVDADSKLPGKAGK